MRGRDHASVEGKAFELGGRAGGADRFRRVLRSGIALAGYHAAAGDLRQQGGERLRLGFQGGEAVGFGFAQLGVVLQGPLIDREEVRGRNRARRQAGERDRECAGQGAGERGCAGEG